MEERTENMILVVNICKEKLHYHEFVKPILDILKKDIKYSVKGYKDITNKDLENADKVVICGTSLQDNDFMDHVEQFKWILEFDKPILGICGGMQVIGKVFGGKLKRKTEIGFYSEDFRKNFLGLSGKTEVYHLHNYHIDFKKLEEFEVFAGNSVAQAVKHKKKEIYGVLFHPEVRQKELIKNFCLR